MRTQTELKARAVIGEGLSLFGPQALPRDVYRIGLVFDRNSWPVDAQIRIAIEHQASIVEQFVEIVSDSPAPGVYTNRFGQIVTQYKLEVSRHSPLLEGSFVRARVVSNRDFDTRVQIILDDTPPPEMRVTNSVTYDDSVSAQATSTAGPLSVSLTIASNSDRLLQIVAGMSATTPPTYTGWSWGADAATEVYDAVQQTFFRVGVATLVAPTAATRNAEATISGTADEAMITATSLYSVDQANPLGTIVVNSGTTTPGWVACDGTTDGMSFGFLYGNHTAIADVDGVPEYIAVGTAVQSAGATTLTPTAPAGALRGDLDFASIATENNNAISCSSSGWSKLGSTVQQDATWQEEIWVRVRTSANVDPVFTWTGSVGCSARRWLIRDVKQTATAIGTHSTNSGTGTTHSITGQNSTANDSIQMYLSHAEANTALGADAGYVEKFDAGSATGPYRLVVGTRDQITSGAGSDNFSATGANASWVMRLIEVLAAGDQTLREEQENIAGITSGSLASESGATYNTFGWTITGTTGWHAIAWSVNPSTGSGPISVTPGTASLVLTGFAPTVSTPRLVTPTTASLVLTGFAPSVATPRRVVPGTGALVTTTFAPTVSTPRLVTPGTGGLTLTGFAPTVTIGVRVTPDTGTLTLTTFAPTVSTPRLVVPSIGTLTLTGFAPTVTVGGSKLVTPEPASLILTGFAPTVTATGGAAVVVTSDTYFLKTTGKLMN